MAIGRIGGPLLAENLLRNEVDLAFDTDLIYFDVNNNKIGFNNDGPSQDLQLTGDSRITGNTFATSTATFGNITVNNTSLFSTNVGEINLRPTGPDAYIEWGRAYTDSIDIKDNNISARGVDQDIGLSGNSAGRVVFQSTTNIDGTLTVNQDLSTDRTLTVAGQVIVGDNPIDTVAFIPDFSQDILPGTTEIYDLGSDPKRWGEIQLYGIAGVDTTTVDSLITSEQVETTGGTIRSTRSNDSLVLSSDSGVVRLEDLTVEDNTITNLLNSPISFAATGQGYLKFGDTNGFILPAGPTDDRPFGEVGETRWNTDLQYLECFDGTVYQVATGGGRVISPDIMEDLSRVYTLIFG